MKSIILFNSKDQSISIIGRNYTDQEATNELINLRSSNLPAFTIDQKGKHLTSDKEGEFLVNEIMSKRKS